MKITQLPEATAVTDEDLAVIVQGGETKKVKRGLLVPKPPEVTVDAELSADSENPVQNKAVSAALLDIKQSVSADCANALKKTVSVNGETAVEDVVPFSALHIRGAQTGQTVTVRGKNLLKAIPERVRNNIDVTDDGIAVKVGGRQTLLNAQELAALNLNPGATVTTSVDIIGENISGTTGQVAIPSKVSGVPTITLRSPGGSNTFTLPADYNPANYSGLCLYGICTYKNLQIEYGTKVTEYEQGFADVTVTANADGNATVENAAYPTAVIETAGACTVEYNRDANCVIEKIEQAILSLGGDI